MRRAADDDAWDDEPSLPNRRPRMDKGSKTAGRNSKRSPAATESSSMLNKLLAVEAADLDGLPLSAGAGFCVLCSYFYLQPLSDALALKVGLEYTPAITASNVVLIAVANPLYASLVKALPVKSVLPIVYGVLASLLAVFGVLFTLLPDSAALSFCFAVFTGTFSLFLTTTFWARMASLHTKPEAKRVFGVIASGAQVGQLCASISAAWLYAVLQQRIVFWSALLICACVYLVNLRGALPPSPGLSRQGDAPAAVPPANEGALQGLARASVDRCCSGVRVLMSTPLLRAITLHTLLITFIVSGIWYERAAAVALAFDSNDARFNFFATQNSIVGLATLFVQLCLFSHLLKYIGVRGALIVEPAIVALGLSMNCVHPGLLSIALLDGGRKVVHYALLKPTKEGLYAALPHDAQFIAKPLLDTLIYRCGSLLGASYFTAALAWGLTAESRRYFLIGVTALWAANSWHVGFAGVDTANHYRNHEGVRKGIAAARAGGHTADVWLQTKMEGCGNSVDPRSPILRGSCYRDTLKVFDDSLSELGVERVDLTLLHSPPCVPGASWNMGCIGHPAQDLVYPHRCDCAAPEPCKMMQQQWKALEEVYAAGKTRSIGVSNYCAACLSCIAQTATVAPHVNQFQLHAGMPGADPAGLISETTRAGAVVQAYRPLAHGQGSLLTDATVGSIGFKHGKSSAQVALRWVLQHGHALVTSTESESHMVADLDVFDWSLSAEEMETLNRLDTSPDDPSIMCVL